MSFVWFAVPTILFSLGVSDCFSWNQPRWTSGKLCVLTVQKNSFDFNSESFVSLQYPREGQSAGAPAFVSPNG